MLAIEMRNRFAVGDDLEILSANSEYANRILHIEKMYDCDMQPVEDAKLVQQLLYIPTDIKLSERDILRKKKPIKQS